MSSLTVGSQVSQHLNLHCLLQSEEEGATASTPAAAPVEAQETSMEQDSTKALFVGV